MKPRPYRYPDLDGLPPELKAEVIGPRRSLNVYRMVMHTPAIAPSFLAFADALRHRSSLPASWRELAILRVGHRYDAPYEVHHHQRIAREAALREPVIAAARIGPTAAGLTAEERLVLEAADQLLDCHGLTAELRDRALLTLSENQLADLVMTVGFYQLVCNFLTTFGVSVES